MPGPIICRCRCTFPSSRSEANNAVFTMRPYILLILAPLFWSGNWLIGRGLHEAVSPVSLNFWRWTVALIVLAFIVGPGLRSRWPVYLQNWKELCLLGLLGIVAFQVMVYVGLRYTTVINAVVLNSTMPIFMVAVSWLMLRETVTFRQALGGVISTLGILAIVSRLELEVLTSLEFSDGDLLILLAMPVWAVYSAILRRSKSELDGLETLAGMSAFAVAIMVPLYIVDLYILDHRMSTSGATLGAVLYVGVFAGVAAFYCWNEGVRGAGPGVAGFIYHLLPAFASFGAVVVLGEDLFLYQVIGIAMILLGVYQSTRSTIR